MIFQPISRQVFSGTLFNDARLEKRYHSFEQSMITHESSIINQVASGHAASTGYYRFLGNYRVSVSELLGGVLGNSTGLSSVAGQHILVAGDTSEISLKNQLSHLKDADQVGLLSDNKTPGFWVHANMAMNAQTGHGLCLSDLLLWSRLKDDAQPNRSYEQKESYKWESGIRNSEALLKQARSITYVFDQESDIFDLWENILNMKSARHFISRVHYDRSVDLIDGSQKLSDYLNTIRFEGSYGIKVRKSDRKNSSSRQIQKRQAREAQIQLRYAPILLKPPLKDPQPITEVFTPEQQKCLSMLNEKYQGKTQKQQNPYPPEQLSWASWIIGRIGGWKGYHKQRPAGPITMKRGLEKFYTYFEAWEFFKERDVYRP